MADAMIGPWLVARAKGEDRGPENCPHSMSICEHLRDER
jgi:hypothetical protein